jgi:hypothetical protein
VVIINSIDVRFDECLNGDDLNRTRAVLVAIRYRLSENPFASKLGLTVCTVKKRE